MLRNPDSISSGDTIIEDPGLEPFFITRSQVGGYVVYERVVKGENKNNYLKNIESLKIKDEPEEQLILQHENFENTY